MWRYPAKHKAGIIKPGVPVITGADGTALDIIQRVAADNKADIYVLGRDFAANAIKPLGQLSIPPNLGNTSVGNMSPSMIDLQIEALSALPYSRCEPADNTPNNQLVEFVSHCDQMASMDYKLALKGLHQVQNSALAAGAAMVLAINDLRITRRALKKAMAAVQWPGRFEVMPRDGYKLIIDGAHNPAGIRILRDSLDYYYPDSRRIFVLGILRDKDFEGMLELLLRPEDRVIFTTPSSERAADPVELLECAAVEAKEAIGDAQKALERSMELAEAGTEDSEDGAPETILVCAGSLYLIGYLRSLLK